MIASSLGQKKRATDLNLFRDEMRVLLLLTACICVYALPLTNNQSEENTNDDETYIQQMYKQEIEEGDNAEDPLHSKQQHHKHRTAKKKHLQHIAIGLPSHHGHGYGGSQGLHHGYGGMGHGYGGMGHGYGGIDHGYGGIGHGYGGVGHGYGGMDHGYGGMDHGYGGMDHGPIGYPIGAELPILPQPHHDHGHHHHHHGHMMPHMPMYPMPLCIVGKHYVINT